MITNTEARTFRIGVGLYAYQAAQSLDRALGSDLNELRKFYSGRICPVSLAYTVIKFDSSIRKVRAGFFSRLIVKVVPATPDYWIMSRLLLDFNNVLKGGDFEGDDLGCLRYCLAVTSAKFLNGAKKLEIGQINYYGRNEILGAGIEIENILGKSWDQIN